MPDILVNNKIIQEDDIRQEMQYHPAPDAETAHHAAARWLVIRELMLQRAKALGIEEEDEADTIQALLEEEVDVPEPDEETCRRYFENNRKRYRSPDLVEAAHILFAAAPDDEDARAEAEEQAKRLIEVLGKEPRRFGELARAHSACNSKESDGMLGQVARGETVPEMDTFLFNMEEGQLCPVPVKTRYGVHVVRVDRNIPGHDLPYEAVAETIAEDLKSQSWRRAFSQYVQLLAGDAKITGFDIAGADSPLVQ